jgi:hypothetical protein
VDGDRTPTLDVEQQNGDGERRKEGTGYAGHNWSQISAISGDASKQESLRAFDSEKGVHRRPSLLHGTTWSCGGQGLVVYRGGQMLLVLREYGRPIEAFGLDNSFLHEGTTRGWYD